MKNSKMLPAMAVLTLALISVLLVIGIAVSLYRIANAQGAGSPEGFITVSASGFGKRTSSYEYRVTGRGGSGIVAMGMARKNNAIVAAFPVEETDDIMLITDQGQTIRVPVSGISIQGRGAQGVTLFRVEEGERVVSVERIEDVSGENGGG